MNSKGKVIENATISDIHEDLGVFIRLNATQDGLFHKNQIPPFIWAQRKEFIDQVHKLMLRSPM